MPCQSRFCALFLVVVMGVVLIMTFGQVKKLLSDTTTFRENCRCL
jgi:hypothetical protein